MARPAASVASDFRDGPRVQIENAPPEEGGALFAVNYELRTSPYMPDVVRAT